MNATTDEMPVLPFSPSSLVGITLEPSKTLRRLIQTPAFVWPIIAVVGSTVFMAWSVGQTDGGWNAVATTLSTMNVGNNPSGLSALNDPHIMAMGVYLSWITSLIGIALLAFIFYGTIWFAAGTRPSMLGVLSCVAYACIPLQLRKMLVGFILAMTKITYNPDDPIVSSLSFLVSKTAHPALWSALSSLDLFSLWTVILLSLAWKEISGMRSKLAYFAMPSLFGSWVILSAFASLLLA